MKTHECLLRVEGYSPDTFGQACLRLTAKQRKNTITLVEAGMIRWAIFIVFHYYTLLPSISRFLDFSAV